MPTSHDTTSVEYRQLPQHPGYRFGSDGSVWSCWKRIGAGRAPGGRSLGYKMVLGTEWKQMACVSDSLGYKVTHLRGCGKLLKVHRLILEAFKGPTPPYRKAECRHLNGIRSDNRIENLEWGTAADNMVDKFRHGTHLIVTRGETHPHSKLTSNDVFAIRSRAKTGESIVSIARDYPHVHENTVGRVVNGSYWKHIKIDG